MFAGHARRHPRFHRAGLGVSMLGVAMLACYHPSELQGAVCESNEWCDGLACINGVCEGSEPESSAASTQGDGDSEGGEGDGDSEGGEGEGGEGSPDGCVDEDCSFSIVSMAFALDDGVTQEVAIPKSGNGEIDIPGVNVLRYEPARGDTRAGYDVSWVETPTEFVFTIRTSAATTKVSGEVWVMNLESGVSHQIMGPQTVEVGCAPLGQSPTTHVVTGGAVAYDSGSVDNLGFALMRTDEGDGSLAFEACAVAAGEGSSVRFHAAAVEIPEPFVRGVIEDRVVSGRQYNHYVELEGFSKIIPLLDITEYRPETNTDMGWVISCDNPDGTQLHCLVNVTNRGDREVDGGGLVSVSGLFIGVP